MSHKWGRRAVLGLAVSACALLASCGGGSVVSDLHANRVVTVGDGFEDVGQTGAKFTVNDGSANWVQSFADSYGLTVTPAKDGGWGYAQGFAHVATADTDSGTSAPSVADQIKTLLARTTLTKNDIVLMNGGMSDIVSAVKATGISQATTDTVVAAADALAGQVQRIVDAGATHVAVTGVYDLCMTPWAVGQGLGCPSGADSSSTAPLHALSTAFNTELLIKLNHFSNVSPNPVLYFDAAQFFDLAYNSVANHTSSSGNYGVTNVTNPVCTTTTALTCTTATLNDPNYNAFMFADNLYFTPAVQRLFVNTDYASNALSRFQHVWGS